MTEQFDHKNEFKHGWIGVDFDGTLAMYTGLKSAGILGDPLMPMVQRVRAWLAEGIEVRIVTARVSPLTPPGYTAKDVELNRVAIGDWCEMYLGKRLVVTHEKDFGMKELWDDRAIQVEANTGEIANSKGVGNVTLDQVKALQEKTKGVETITEWMRLLREFADEHGIADSAMNGIWGLELGNIKF